MALFANGMDRVIDGKRGQKRWSGVWNVICKGLLQELKEKNKVDPTDDNGDDSCDNDGSGSSKDSSSVISSDSNCEQDANLKNKNKSGSTKTTMQMKL